MSHDIGWLPEPESHDYDAAESFLSLLASPDVVPVLAYKLERVPTVTHPAKDVLRAIGTDGNPLSALLPAENEHVAKVLRKIHDGVPLSPVLLVVDTARARLLIADGDHRVCGVYHHDEDALVHARLIYW